MSAAPNPVVASAAVLGQALLFVIAVLTAVSVVAAVIVAIRTLSAAVFVVASAHVGAIVGASLSVAAVLTIDGPGAMEPTIGMLAVLAGGGAAIGAIAAAGWAWRRTRAQTSSRQRRLAE